MFLYETLRKAIIWTLIYTVANAEYILTQVTFGRIPGVTDNSNTQGQWHVCRGKAAAHTSSYWLPLMYEEYREFVLRSPEEENHWHVSILLDDLAKRGQESMQRRERLMHLKNCQKCAHMDLLFQHSPAHSLLFIQMSLVCSESHRSVSAINAKLYYCMRQQLLNVTVRIISKLGSFSYGCAMPYCCLLNSQIRSGIACGLLIKLMSQIKYCTQKSHLCFRPISS